MIPRRAPRRGHAVRVPIVTNEELLDACVAALTGLAFTGFAFTGLALTGLAFSSFAGVARRRPAQGQPAAAPPAAGSGGRSPEGA